MTANLPSGLRCPLLVGPAGPALPQGGALQGEQAVGLVLSLLPSPCAACFLQGVGLPEQAGLAGSQHGKWNLFVSECLGQVYTPRVWVSGQAACPTQTLGQAGVQACSHFGIESGFSSWPWERSASLCSHSRTPGSTGQEPKARPRSSGGESNHSPVGQHLSLQNASLTCVYECTTRCAPTLSQACASP